MAEVVVPAGVDANQPAFPNPGMAPGMTIRDYFAAQALAGVLASEASETGDGVFMVAKDTGEVRFFQQNRKKPEDYALVAYIMADAMLDARKAKY